MRTSITRAVLTATAVALAAPAVAGASELPLEFDNAVLDTPATPNQVIVAPKGKPITATATVDDATGTFTIPVNRFDFPKYSFNQPTAGEIDVILNEPATGQIDLATGKVTMSANFQAQVTLTAFGQCNIDTDTLLVSTETSEPLPGKRFPAGIAGFGSGPGALGVGWETLPPGTGPGCPLIDAFVSGPGGIWISNGIAPKTDKPAYDVARLGVTVKPKNARIKVGEKAKFKVTVKNPGDTAATDVETCAKRPKGAKTCLQLGTLAAGKKRTVTFRTQAAKKPGTSKVIFTATGDGAKGAKATAKVVVRAPKG